MTWADRFGVCRSVASWLSKRYDLDYFETLNDTVVTVLDEEKLINGDTRLLDPRVTKDKYWRAIKNAVERQRRPPRCRSKRGRHVIRFSQIKDDPPADRDPLKLLELKDTVNAVLRHVDRDQYKIITRILSAALNADDGVCLRSGTFAVKKSFAAAIGDEFGLSARAVKQILKAFLIDCRNEND